MRRIYCCFMVTGALILTPIGGPLADSSSGFLSRERASFECPKATSKSQGIMSLKGLDYKGNGLFCVKEGTDLKDGLFILEMANPKGVEFLVEGQFQDGKLDGFLTVTHIPGGVAELSYRQRQLWYKNGIKQTDTWLCQDTRSFVDGPFESSSQCLHRMTSLDEAKSLSSSDDLKRALLEKLSRFQRNTRYRQLSFVNLTPWPPDPNLLQATLLPVNFIYDVINADLDGDSICNLLLFGVFRQGERVIVRYIASLPNSKDISKLRIHEVYRDELSVPQFNEVAGVYFLPTRKGYGDVFFVVVQESGGELMKAIHLDSNSRTSAFVFGPDRSRESKLLEFFPLRNYSGGSDTQDVEASLQFLSSAPGQFPKFTYAFCSVREAGNDGCLDCDESDPEFDPNYFRRERVKAKIQCLWKPPNAAYHCEVKEREFKGNKKDGYRTGFKEY